MFKGMYDMQISYHGPMNTVLNCIFPLAIQWQILIYAVTWCNTIPQSLLTIKEIYIKSDQIINEILRWRRKMIYLKFLNTHTRQLNFEYT